MSKILLAKNESHQHYALVDSDGNGITTKKNNHQHLIQMINKGTQEQPKMVSTVLPENNDGHTHELKDYKFKRKKTNKKSQEEKRFKKAVELARDSFANESEFIERGKINEGFYMGGDGQWPAAVLSKLIGAERAHLSLNYIKPIINKLHGYHQQNATTIKYSPKIDGSAVVADMLTAMATIILEKNSYKEIKGEVFMDVMITGRGYAFVQIDGPRLENGELVFSEKNIQGDIKINHEEWDLVTNGYYISRDGSDREYTCLSKWISLGKLKNLVPDKREAIEEYNYFGGGHEWKSEQKINRDEVKKVTGDVYKSSSDWIDIKNKSIRLCKVYMKDYVLSPFIVDLRNHNNFEINLTEFDLSKEQIDELLTIKDLEKITKTDEEIWETNFAANIHINTERKDFKRLPNPVAHGVKRKDKIQGKIDDLKDSQMEKNKRRSTIADQANMTGQFITLRTSDLDETQNTVENAKEIISGNGGVLMLNDNAGVDAAKLQKGIQVDPTLITLDMQATKDMEMISGVNATMNSQGNDIKSSSLYQDHHDDAILGNEVYFEGMQIFEKELGLLLLEMMPLCYDADTVYRMLNNRHMDTANPAIELAGQPMAAYTEDTIKKLWEGNDLSKYEITVTQNQYSPTKRLADFKAFSTIIGQVSDPTMLEFMVEMSDMPPKEKEKLKAITQRGAQQKMAVEQMKSQTELDKTAMANANSGQQPQG